MSNLDPAVARHRGRVAALSRTDKRQAIAEARRDLDRANLEAHIRRVVAGAPPITPEQRDRLAAIIYAHPTATE